MNIAYNNAETLWDFHSKPNSLLSFFSPHINYDVSIGLGSYDTDVAVHCANLLITGRAGHIIVTGSKGNWTSHLSGITEAQVFEEVLLKMEVAPANISLESKATNIGENLEYSLVLANNLGFQSAIFVTKSQTLMRLETTLQKKNTFSQYAVSSHQKSFKQAVSQFGLSFIANEMVGDLERIIEYPKLGFSAPIEVPNTVKLAYSNLRANGFTKHSLISVAG